MDLAFLRRAERMLANGKPARLDHPVLCAMLEAQRPVESARSPSGAADMPHFEDDPLTELLIAGPAWRRASVAQQGCFSRAEAGRRINSP